jgi:hypothetical protein
MWMLKSGQKMWWNGQSFAPTQEGFAAYKASNSPNNPGVDSILTSATAAETFIDYIGNNFSLRSGSPAVDAGSPLTRAVNSGSSSKTLVVDRASFFTDGYRSGEESLIEPDQIVIGDSAAVAIFHIDDAANTIILESPRSWSVGDDVTLVYNGASPDLGAFEFGSAGDPKPKELLGPSNLRIAGQQNTFVTTLASTVLTK